MMVKLTQGVTGHFDLISPFFSIEDWIFSIKLKDWLETKMSKYEET